MSLQGSFRSLSIPDLLSLLNGHKKTGLLHLVSAKDERGILFLRGDILYASSPESSRRLGDHLLARGAVSEADLICFTTPRAGEVGFLGQELIQTGRVSPEALSEAVRKQVLETLNEVLLWEEAAFHFDEWDGSAPLPLPPGQPISTQTVLLEAIRRLDESELVREAFPDLAATPVRTSKESAPGKVDRDEEEVLELVDGRRTLGQVLRDSFQSPYETSILLGDLIRGGRIEVVPGTRARQESPWIPEPWVVPVAPDVPGRIYRVLRRGAATPLENEAVVREVAGDAALAGKLLRHLASARIALPREELSVRGVIAALGISRLREALVPEAVRGIFFGEPDFFWRDHREHAMRCAHACRELALQVGYPYPDEAYLAGLLANFGVFVLAGAHPEDYRGVLEEARATGCDLCELEEAAFGASHVTIGGIYAERWRFPRPIVQAIKGHHQAKESPGPLLDLVALGGWVAGIRDPGIDVSRNGPGQLDGALRRFRLKRKKLMSLSAVAPGGPLGVL